MSCAVNTAGEMNMDLRISTECQDALNNYMQMKIIHMHQVKFYSIICK